MVFEGFRSVSNSYVYSMISHYSHFDSVNFQFVLIAFVISQNKTVIHISLHYITVHQQNKFWCFFKF